MKLSNKPVWIIIQYICVLFLALCFTGLIVADFMFIWFIIMLLWLFIPAIIVACISFSKCELAGREAGEILYCQYASRKRRPSAGSRP